MIGGRSTYEGAKPNHSWNPGAGHLGALEIDLRYGALQVDPHTFPTFADPWVSASSARSMGATLQWVPASLFRFLVSFERVAFVGGAGTKEQVVDRPPELALIMRAQLSL